MPLTRIRQTAIGADAITTPKLDDTAGGLTLPGTQYVHVPVGTTAQRPSSPANGYLRYNTNFERLEQYADGQWQAIDTPPSITSLSYSGSATAADPVGGETITLAGSNFQTGATVTVDGTSATSVSVVSSTSITFTTPAKTAGDYNVTVTNANGLAATLLNGISYNGVPSFTTAAGNVGSIAEDQAMSTITIVAAEPDGGTLAYSVTSGALPTGVSMSSAGAITGTPNVNPTSSTTFNFTVTATDDENQTNSRAFNLIVLRPIYATSIDDSLRFNDDDSAYLTRTASSAGNRRTWTWSAWVKKNNDVLGHMLWGGGTAIGSGTPDHNATIIRFNSDNKLLIFSTDSDSASLNLTTTQVFRDVGAWMHLLVAFDTTQATNSNRIKLYVNGSQVTSFSTETYPSQNYETHINENNIVHIIGCKLGPNPEYFYDGYMSDVHLIDGQALTPTSFAEEYNGVWAPKAYSGSYGTNGFKLNFSDSSNLGDDTSGNTNDLTASGFSVSDSVIDSPTNNFATLNPLTQGSYTRTSEGMLRLSAVYGADLSGISATQYLSSGKWYWEVRPNAVSTYPYIGIGSSGRMSSTQGMYYSVGWPPGGAAQTSGTELGTITATNVGSYTNGDIIMFALDADARKLWWGENGTWANSGDPVAGTGEIASWTVDEDVSPILMGYAGQGVGTIINFGQDSTFAGNVTVASNADSNGIGEFQYSPPTNFLAVTSKNLSESTINTTLDDRPEDYFNTVLYTGDHTYPKSITNVGFQPDLVWIKDRDNGYNHRIFDSIRGSAPLYPNNNSLEDDANDGPEVNMVSNGFTIIDNPDGANTGGFGVNANGTNYVAWSWKAGGAPTATNSAGAGAVPTSGSVMIDGVASTSALAGTIPATKLTANTKTGFSIVSYTGTGSNATVGHGLNSTPSMIIAKRRDTAENWPVYTVFTGSSQYGYLDSANPFSSATSVWQGVDPTSSVFSIGTSLTVNASSGTYIAYCFHSVEGYSKIGSYTGNSSSDGVFVHTGFKPAFFMVKAAIGFTNNWYMYDNKTTTFNPDDTYLQANGSGGEVTANAIDFLSNGIKLRNSSQAENNSSGTYIFMAFAEDPFKYAEAR
jgi:hypothetical protein